MGSWEAWTNAQIMMATVPLSKKFGVARYTIVTNMKEGDETKYSHIQSTIVSIVHCIKQGEAWAKAVNWMDICTFHFLSSNTSNIPTAACDGIVWRGISGRIGASWS